MPRRIHGRVPGWLHSSLAHCRFGPFPSGVLRRHSFHSLLRSPLRITFQHATCRRTTPCPPAPLPSEPWPSQASSAVASSDTRPCTRMASFQAGALPFRTIPFEHPPPARLPFPVTLSAPIHILTRHVSPDQAVSSGTPSRRTLAVSGLLRPEHHSLHSRGLTIRSSSRPPPSRGRRAASPAPPSTGPPWGGPRTTARRSAASRRPIARPFGPIMAWPVRVARGGRCLAQTR